MLKSSFAVVALTVAMLGSLACAAGPFDGDWTGSIGRGGSCPGADVVAKITDGTLAGEEHIAQFNWPVSGSVDASGSFTGKINGLDLKGKFEGSHFTGTYYSPDCKVSRELRMDKSG